jgi:hypothetical protein
MTKATGTEREDSMGVEVGAQFKGLEVRVSAKGFYASCVVAFGSVAAELIWLSPTSNPQHFMLTIFSVGVAGFLGGTAIMVGRLNDMRERIADFRAEIDRMADEKKPKETKVMQGRRLSSETSSSEQKKLPSGKHRG